MSESSLVGSLEPIGRLTGHFSRRWENAFQLGESGLLIWKIRVEYVGEEWFGRLLTHYGKRWGAPLKHYIWRQTRTLPVEGYVPAPSYEIAIWVDAADTRVEIKSYLHSDVTVLSFIDLRGRQ